MTTCPFCDLPDDRIIAADGPCVAFHDRYPVSKGHTLIIPKRHIASSREMTPEEWAAIHRLACAITKRMQEEDERISAFNLGINDGPAAGQSVPHAHVHLIPRRSGDVPKPRGGVRGVIPGKADYPG